MKLKPLGLAVTTVAIVAPIYWMAPLAAERDSIALLSQYFGIVALIAMALTQIIATRLSFVEHIFGGLDRSYVLHKWLGIIALSAILLHDTIDAEMRGLGRQSVLVDVAETAGEISLYGILILIVISIATFIPYHLWFWTHKLMGTFFAISAFHFMFIQKPFANPDPLGLYVIAICALGVLSYLYKLGPNWMRPKHRYQVDQVAHVGSNTVVTLTPDAKPLQYHAGQFAFLQFESAGLHEPHPFTISKAPDDMGALRFSIAPLGDLTGHALRQVKPGTTAKIEGPYGRFKRKKTKGSEIWIAAGIGVTPFVAWAQTLDENDNVTLYYCVKNAEAAPHLAELQEIAARHSTFNLVVHESTKSGRLDPKTIAAQAGDGFAKAHVYFCGPKPMREALQTRFASLGLSARRFHFEAFDIRTGIGLNKLAAWILKRVSEARK